MRRHTIMIVTVALLMAMVVATGLFASGDTETEGEAEVSGTLVEYWARDFGEAQSEWREYWVEQYNAENPDATVELTIVPADGWDQKFTGAQAVGETPDVVHYSYNQVLPVARNGEILAVSDYMSQDVINDIYPNVRDMVAMDGKIWAYPELVEPSMVLYYNKTMFEEAGLDPEVPPTSWDELLEYAKALTTEDHYGLLIPFNAVELGWTLWGMRYGTTGHRLISEDWSESLADDPAYHDLAAFWKSLYDEGVVPRQALAAYVDIAPFGNEQAAMAFCGSWGIGGLKREWPDLVENVGVTNAPTIDGDYERATASLGGWTLTIDAMTDVPQAAADFIAWTLGGNPAIMVDYFTRENFSKYSARISVDAALAQDEAASADPFMAFISERVVPYAVSETAYPFDINIAFGNALERVYLQDMEIAESFAVAHQEIQNIIANQELAGTNPAMR